MGGKAFCDDINVRTFAIKYETTEGLLSTNELLQKTKLHLASRQHTVIDDVITQKAKVGSDGTLKLDLSDLHFTTTQQMGKKFFTLVSVFNLNFGWSEMTIAVS